MVNVHDVSSVERLYEMLGITVKAAHEFTTHNIKSFNVVCEDNPDVRYYSIGARKNWNSVSFMLRSNHDLIVNDTLGIECDGLVKDVEAEWGNYLITFDNDHLEVMGF